MPRHNRTVHGYQLRPLLTGDYIAVIGLKHVRFCNVRTHCWVAQVRRPPHRVEAKPFCMFRTLRECVAHAIKVFDPMGHTLA
jgi:hypothetical protein